MQARKLPPVLVGASGSGKPLLNERADVERNDAITMAPGLSVQASLSPVNSAYESSGKQKTQLNLLDATSAQAFEATADVDEASITAVVRGPASLTNGLSSSSPIETPAAQTDSHTDAQGSKDQPTSVTFSGPTVADAPTSGKVETTQIYSNSVSADDASRVEEKQNDIRPARTHSSMENSVVGEAGRAVDSAPAIEDLEVQERSGDVAGSTSRAVAGEQVATRGEDAILDLTADDDLV